MINAKSPRSRISGFTLVELLVVIAIIGILVSLLLPAVQSAREAARMMSCKNNLKQIALALHNYDSSMQRFPPGAMGGRDTPQTDGLGHGWTAFILPYVEESPLFDSLVWVDSETWNGGGTNMRAVQTYIATFRCPSTNAPEREDCNDIPDRVPGSYIGCGSGLSRSDDIIGEQDGILYNLSGVRMAQVVDGTSQTLLVGEKSTFVYGACMDYWYIGSTNIDSGYGSDFSEFFGSTWARINSHKQLGVTTCISENELAFGSEHPGGTHIGMADGSVRFAPEGVDRAVWSAVGTRDGEEVVEPVGL